MLSYSTTDLARELHTDRNKIDLLRNSGLIHGIKIGRGYIFPKQEVDRFLHDLLDQDLSNPESIEEVKGKMEGALHDSH